MNQTTPMMRNKRGKIERNHYNYLHGNFWYWYARNVLVFFKRLPDIYGKALRELWNSLLTIGSFLVVLICTVLFFIPPIVTTIMHKRDAKKTVSNKDE